MISVYVSNRTRLFSIYYWKHKLQTFKYQDSFFLLSRVEDRNKALAQGITLPSFQQMGENEMQAVDKLHEISSFIAFRGYRFLDFLDHIELEKLHDVKYIGACENERYIKTLCFASLNICLMEVGKKA